MRFTPRPKPDSFVTNTLRPETAAMQQLAQYRQTCKDDKKRTYFTLAAIAVVVAWAYEYFKPTTDSMKYVRYATIFGGTAFAVWNLFFRSGETWLDNIKKDCDTAIDPNGMFNDIPNIEVMQPDNTAGTPLLWRIFAA